MNHTEPVGVHTSFFQHCPTLQPFRIVPSEDHPKEYVLVNRENGAALGITSTERLIVESLDGHKSTAQIVRELTDENKAKLTDVRRLIWDLDRYGFLEESPWPEVSKAEASGYWGFFQTSPVVFHYTSVLGPFEKGLSALFASSFYSLVVTLISIVLILSGWDQFQKQSMLVMNQSIPLAVVIMATSILAFLILALWFMAVTLRGIHPSHVLCHWSQEGSFPRIRLDGRRLRIFPVWKSLAVSLSPPATVLFLASIAGLLSKYSQGIRSEWLFHLFLSGMMVSFLLCLPWFSTVMSRDIVLRLRGDSLWWINIRSIRNAFASLFTPTEVPSVYDRLFLGWGIWSLLSTVLLIRFATTLFRTDVPILIVHFQQEQSTLVLILFVVLSSIVSLVLFITIATWVTRIGKEVAHEFNSYLLPRHDEAFAHAIITIGFLINLYIAFVGTIPFQIVHTVGAFGLLILGIISYWRSKGGFESFPTIAVFFTGVVMLLGLSSPQSMNTLFTGLLWFSMAFLVFYTLIYPIHLCCRQFQRLKNVATDIPFGVWIIVSTAILLLALNIRQENRLHWIEPLWLDMVFRVFFFVGLIGFPIWMGRFRNHSWLYINCGFWLVWGTLGWSLGGSQTMNIGLGLAPFFTMAGLLLRETSLRKVALGQVEDSTHSNFLSFDSNTLCLTMRNACAQLYEATPKIPIPKEPYDDSAYQYNLRMHKLTGTQSFRAVVRGAIRNLPWSASKLLSTLLPEPLSMRQLSARSEEQIVSFIQNIPTFMYTGDEVHRLAAASRYHVYDPGDVLIQQDAVGKELFIVLEGKVAVEEEHPFGRTRRAVLTAGDFVGEISFLTDQPRTATVRALEPTLVLALNRDQIDDSMPQTKQWMDEAQEGRSWLQVLGSFKVFREFPAPLRSRVCLEAHHLSLEVGRTLVLHEDEMVGYIPVILDGTVAWRLEEYSEFIQQGAIVGFQEMLEEKPLHGVLRAESPSHVLLVDRSILQEAVTELLTPHQVLQCRSAFRTLPE